MDKIVNALLEGVRELGIEAELAPQKTSANRPRVELFFSGIDLAGIDRHDPEKANKGWERIIFNAEFKSEGTHSRWVADTILASRKLLPFTEAPMRLTVDADKRYNISAHWRRLVQGRFEYPSEEQSSMPVRYIQTWEITVAYPAQIINGLEPEDAKPGGENL